MLKKPKIREAIDSRLAELRVSEPDDVATKIRKRKATIVYLVRAANGLVKIGKTVDIASRFNTLNTASPIDLEMIGAIHSDCASEIEGALHAQFAGKRVKGEWFALSEEDVASIGEQYVLQ